MASSLTQGSERYYLFGFPISHSASPALHNALFAGEGFPDERRSYTLEPTDTISARMRRLCREEEFGGASVTMPLKIDVVQMLDYLTPEARAISAVNTIVPRKRADGTIELVGTNTDWLGVRNSLLHSLTGHLNVTVPLHTLALPPATAAACIIGGGGTCRAAVYALTSLNCAPLYIVNRDAGEVASVMAQFPNVRIVPLGTFEDAQAALESGPSLAIVVGCVPAIPPVTPAEILADSIACFILSSPYKQPSPSTTLHSDLPPPFSLPLPSLRTFLDMCYKPRITPLMTHAVASGSCTVVSGIEAMLEQGLAQSRMWLAKDASAAVGSGTGIVGADGRIIGVINGHVEDTVKKMLREMSDVAPDPMEAPLND